MSSLNFTFFIKVLKKNNFKKTTAKKLFKLISLDSTSNTPFRFTLE